MKTIKAKKARPKAKGAFVWPAERLHTLISALDFCIERLKPHVSKNPLIKHRRDMYVWLRKVILSAGAPKDGMIRVTINAGAAALIRPAVVSYMASLRKKLPSKKKPKRR